MNGKDLFNNLVDELNRARDLLQDNEIDFDLVSDIDADLDRVFDYQDSIDSLLEDLVIQEEIEK